MRLEVHIEPEGDPRRIDAPTVADVRAAIPDMPPHPDWSIYLVRSEEDSIEAEVHADGGYAVAYVEGRRIYDGKRPVTAETLRSMFARFHAGDGSWRNELDWSMWEPPARAKGPGLGHSLTGRWIDSPAAGYTFAGIMIAVSLSFFFLPMPRISLPHIPLPAMFDSTAARIILVFASLVLLLVVVAVVWKLIEARRAARWPQAAGRIVHSSEGVEERSSGPDDPPREVAIADVRYEFQAAGRKFEGNRVSLAEITPESEVPGILAKYPVGKVVMVYYDPKNPNESVLERDLPEGLGQGCLVALGMAVAALFGVMWLVTNGVQTTSSFLPNARSEIMLPTLVIGVLLVWFYIALRRSQAKAEAWPKVDGTVTSSGVIYGGRNDAANVYRPSISYSYRVDGRAYTGRQITLDTTVSGSKGFAEKQAAKYPLGAKVTVHYDPADPTRAALKLGGGWHGIVLVLGVMFLAAAAATSGLFD